MHGASSRATEKPFMSDQPATSESDSGAAPSRAGAVKAAVARGAGTRVEQHYQSRLLQLRQQATELQRLDRRYSSLRGITFLIVAAAGLYAAIAAATQLWPAVGVVGIVFVIFVVLHARVSTRQFDVDHRISLCERGLQRVSATYRAEKKREHVRGDARVDPGHAYSGDLDIFGPGSLFEQLNTTSTAGGADKLAGWLTAPASAAEIRARQQALLELSGRDELREELALEGMRAGDGPDDSASFIGWCGISSDFAAARRPLLLGGGLLVALTAGSFISSWFVQGLWTRAWLVCVALQVVFLLGIRSRIEPILGPITQGKQSPLGRYHGLLRLIEQERFDDAMLEKLRASLAGPGGVPASAEMRRLDGLLGLAAVRHNALIIILADTFLLWDLWCAFALDRWRARCGRHVARWVDALAELEALVSLATFAAEHPDYGWPEVLGGVGPHYEATRLGHPLLPAASRICNDVSLNAEICALMITGSNMSGKSTMLRSIGINAVLAQAGAPVCAARLRMSELQVQTSMRVTDSLEAGTSRFYMEVKKLKQIVDRLQAGGAPVLFLLDEILHGTNSRERNIGAKAVVTYLVERGCIGAVSSHDLGLVTLEELSSGKVRNMHFEDHLENGKMCFDYRMKPGSVATSNALRLMRQVGLEMIGEDGDDSEPA